MPLVTTYRYAHNDNRHIALCRECITRPGLPLLGEPVGDRSVGPCDGCTMRTFVFRKTDETHEDLLSIHPTIDAAKDYARQLAGDGAEFTADDCPCIVGRYTGAGGEYWIVELGADDERR